MLMQLTVVLGALLALRRLNNIRSYSLILFLPSGFLVLKDKSIPLN